jgi:tRNA (cytosine34-C5)-methyltransferase
MPSSWRDRKRDDYDANQGRGGRQIVRDNADWQEYYQHVLGEQECKRLHESFVEPLPMSWRITSTSPFVPLVKRELVAMQESIGQTELFYDPSSNRVFANADATRKDENVEKEKEKEKEKDEKDASMKDDEEEEKVEMRRAVGEVRQLTWANDAWELTLPLPLVKKSGAENVKAVHRWLVTQAEAGSVSRQELVSMVPPHFLGVTESDLVLDLCAAPGSKTKQLMEMMVLDARAKGKLTASGGVIANDCDYKRCKLLVHQVKTTHLANYLVTCELAQHFPTLGSLKFDRVLCDVPCSGDGTFRKSPDLWRRWKRSMCHGLHPVQVSIAQRGFELLRVGGRLVYSTCSVNPIENEAVVADLLRSLNGAGRLVDVSDMLPGLARLPGLKTWRVHCPGSKDGAYFESRADLMAYRDARPELASRYLPPIGFFPPLASEVDELRLERCARFHPYLQDTGGFFIAAIEKVRELDVVNTEETEETEELEEAQKTSSSSSLAPSSFRCDSKFEEPFISWSNATGVEADQTQLTELFGLKDDTLWRQCFVRSDSPKRLIHVASPGIVRVLAASSEKNELSIVNAGQTLFARHRVDARRVCTDGIAELYPHVSKRVVRGNLADLKQLLASKEACAYELLSESLQQQCKALSIGSAIVAFDLPATVASGEYLGSLMVHTAGVSLYVDKQTKAGLHKMLSDEASFVEQQQ